MSKMMKLTNSGPGCTPESRVGPWILPTPHGGFNGDPYGRVYMADLMNENGPQNNISDTAATWIIPAGGLMLIRPWLQGDDNCESYMYVSTWRQRECTHKDANIIPAWTFDLLYVVNLRAVATQQDLMVNASNTTIGGSWRGVDSLVSTARDRMISPDPRWIGLDGDDIYSTLVFDTFGAPLVEITFSIDHEGTPVPGTPATRMNLEYCYTNSG